jgi:hypothetical protein
MKSTEFMSIDDVIESFVSETTTPYDMGLGMRAAVIYLKELHHRRKCVPIEGSVLNQLNDLWDDLRKQHFGKRTLEDVRGGFK